MDQGADGRPAGGVRAGDHAVQRQRLYNGGNRFGERLLRAGLKPGLERPRHQQRPRDRALDVGAVPGHWQRQLPATDLPDDGGDGRSSCSPTRQAGKDGYLHGIANAHETQWAVQDPTTDIAADQALFPAVVKAATLLHTDAALVAELRTADKELEPYPRTDEATKTELLNPQPTSPSAAAKVDAKGGDVIADSYQPAATLRNGENIGLEPVWPYGDIGDHTVVNGDNLTALADRSYDQRPNVTWADWSFDAVDAARLDLSGQVAVNLTDITEHYQGYLSGLANLSGGGTGDEAYIEQGANVATALDEALATDYDGTLRFAPAWPSGWNAAGTVYIQGGSKVDVQVEGGVLATAAIKAGTTETMTVRNPWPGRQAEVVNGSTGAVVVRATTAATFTVRVKAGGSYLVEQPSSPTTALPFAQVTGTRATAARHLGPVQIGLDRAG